MTRTEYLAMLSPSEREICRRLTGTDAPRPLVRSWCDDGEAMAMRAACGDSLREDERGMWRQKARAA